MRLIAVTAVVLAVATIPASSAAQEVPADSVIKLERTACFGECPVYSVSIDAKGNVTYDGTEFVRVKGRQTDRILVSRVAELLATADRIGFFDLRDQYRTIRNPDGTETIVTDLPTTFVTITRGGRSKRVEDYIGAPVELKQLEDQIDETARTVRWVRLDVPTLQRLVRRGRFPTGQDRAELLREALMYDEVDVVRALLRAGVAPNWRYYATNTPPLMMVRSSAAARALIEAAANARASNDNGVTPLGMATYLSPDVTELLLKSGVEADQRTDSDGRSALWQASCLGNAGAVKLLLDAGADPRLQAANVSAFDCARHGKETPAFASARRNLECKIRPLVRLCTCEPVHRF